jgi:hypothetical protein
MIGCPQTCEIERPGHLSAAATYGAPAARQLVHEACGEKLRSDVLAAFHHQPADALGCQIGHHGDQVERLPASMQEVLAVAARWTRCNTLGAQEAARYGGRPRDQQALGTPDMTCFGVAGCGATC